MRSACQLVFYYALMKPFLWLFTGAMFSGIGGSFWGAKASRTQPIRGRGPFIIVANHNSHLDTAVIFHMIGGRRLAKVRPVAAADYFCRSRLRRFLTTRLFNILPIERSALRCQVAVDQMSAALADGQSLIIFPEGTRGVPERMEPFHSGVGHLVHANPGVPVIPMYIHGSGAVMPKGTWLPIPHLVRVHVGEPEYFRGAAKDITAELADRVSLLGTACGLEPAAAS